MIDTESRKNIFQELEAKTQKQCGYLIIRIETSGLPTKIFVDIFASRI